MRWQPAVVLVAPTILTSCSSSGSPTPDEFTGVAVASAVSQNNLFEIGARFSPDSSPIRGINAAEIRVVDPAGTEKDGLQLDVITWMPAMNHGSAVLPTVSPQGGGRYFADNVDLFMPGHWQLRVKLTDPINQLSDQATLELDVR